MRIAIDASRTTVQRVTGTENYAIRLIRALIALNTEHDITLYFRDTPSPDLFPAYPRVKHRVIPFRRVWTHLRFAIALRQDHPDITFVPAHTLPFWMPGRAVVTVHDLGFKYFPDAHPTADRLYLDYTTLYSAWRAHTVLVDSRATADDLNLFYKVIPQKIEVVYPGVDSPSPPTSPEATEAVRRKYNLPRKNIPVIVQAFQRWRMAHPDDGAGLVLAGGKGWLYDETWASGLPGLYLPGYIDEADKGALYAGALALVFPSLYEGFGFPVIEAMRCGTPVITSNTSSLPELAGHAALFVDPIDVGVVASSMARIVDDPDLRSRLVTRGYEQAAKFRWERAAEQALQALEQAAT
jgi:glycosyltransferase involved in cell wall biosynthesis